MKKLFAAALAALALVGCASTQNAYIEAQKAALVREGDARVAEANAIAAVAGKLDAGGAAAYAVTVALRGVSSSQVRAPIERPRDWLDYLNGVTSAVATIGNIAVPIISVREAGKTQRAGFDRDVAVESARQGGESARIATVGQIAAAVGTAPRPPTTVITVNAGGDSIVGGGTIDRRDCRTRGGAGAGGPVTSSGAVPGPGAPLTAAGGAGGAATGGC
jgi:ABC-type amino acid transport substrate-binding protein